MHEIKNKKFYLGPKFGTLFHKSWITISELLHGPGILICGYPKGISMSVAPETLRKLQTRVESPNFNL
jgi:hypothetical protein